MEAEALHKINLLEPGIEGLDELAADLGVADGVESGIGVEGRSGRLYSLIGLLTAHVREMRTERGRR